MATVAKFLEHIGFDAEDNVWLECRGNVNGSNRLINQQSMPILTADVWGKFYAPQGNCYFVSALLNGSQTRKDSDVARHIAVVLDLDAKHFAPDRTVADLLELIETHLPSLGKASAHLATGGGSQAYWRFDPKSIPRLAHVGTVRKCVIWAVSKLAMEAGILTHRLDSVSSEAHLFRLPGTINHKYSPTREVGQATLSDTEPVDLARVFAECSAVLGLLDGSGVPLRTGSSGSQKPRSTWAVLKSGEHSCKDPQRLPDYFVENYRDPNGSGSRHYELLICAMRLEAHLRYGCLTEADYETTKQALNAKFLSLFDIDNEEERTVAKEELPDIWTWALARIESMSNAEYEQHYIRAGHKEPHKVERGLVAPSQDNPNSLPIEFWKESDVLTQSRTYALARRSNPDTTLIASCTYILAKIPYYVVAKNRRRGDSQPLNGYALLLGPSGGTKSASMKNGARFLRREAKWFANFGALETAQSIAAMYVHAYKKPNEVLSPENPLQASMEDDKPPIAEAKPQEPSKIYQAAYGHPVDIQRAQELANDPQMPSKMYNSQFIFLMEELAGMQGFLRGEATQAAQTLALAYFSSDINPTLKTDKLRLRLLAMTYRTCLLAGLQTNYITSFMKYETGGLPQRTFIANATKVGLPFEEYESEDPDVSYPALREPWSVPDFGERDPDTGLIELEIPPDVTAIIQQREKENDGRNNHLETIILRYGFALAFLHGERNISMKYFLMADKYLRTYHLANWEFIDQHIRWAHTKHNRNRGIANAEARLAEKEYLAKSEQEKIRSVAMVVANAARERNPKYCRTAKHAEIGCSQSCFTLKLGRAGRKYLEDALAYSVGVGWLTTNDNKYYRPGDKKP